MSHKFEFENRKKLDSEERKKILPPFELLAGFGLKKKDITADFGAGTGYFTFPAAEIAGPFGMVYALDISEKMLEEIENKIKEAGSNLLENAPAKESSPIKTVKISEDDLVLENSCVDFFLASQVLHEVNDISVTIKEIKRILKNNGTLAVIEWQKIEFAEYGPPENHRLAPGELISVLENNGFEDIILEMIGSNFYSIQAKLMPKV